METNKPIIRRRRRTIRRKRGPNKAKTLVAVNTTIAEKLIVVLYKMLA